MGVEIMDRPGVWQVPEGSGERKNGENWLQNYLWCPSDPGDQGIDDDDDVEIISGKKFCCSIQAELGIVRMSCF